MPRWLLGTALLLIGLSGCAGATEPLSVDGEEGTLLLDADPLPSVDPAEWSEAPAGCEGALSANVRFGIAAEAPDLVVALDEDGVAICVDSFPAIESELAATDLDADAFWMGYMAALQEAPLGVIDDAL